MERSTRERPPCLVVADVLTEDERREIQERWNATNPNYGGAPVADLLDILWDSDAHLDVREPFAEAHPDLFEGDGRIASHVVIAVVWLDETGEDFEARVREILGRIQ